jgi:hypothetical protein
MRVTVSEGQRSQCAAAADCPGSSRASLASPLDEVLIFALTIAGAVGSALSGLIDASARRCRCGRGTRQSASSDYRTFFEQVRGLTKVLKPSFPPCSEPSSPSLDPQRRSGQRRSAPPSRRIKVPPVWIPNVPGRRPMIASRPLLMILLFARCLLVCPGTTRQHPAPRSAP